MSVFTSLGIVFLATLILASLKLTSGVFALLYHYALGKYSQKRASLLSIFFILGVETITACLFLSAFYITYVFFFDNLHPESTFLAYFAAIVFIILAFVGLFAFFRPGPGTRLLIPRSFAQAFNRAAKSVTSCSDAFVLGAFSAASELIFTLPLFLVASIEIAKLNESPAPSLLLTFLLILAPIFPLLISRWRFQTGHNLADQLRSRTKNKTFTRFILGFSYLVIAILILCFRTI